MTLEIWIKQTDIEQLKKLRSSWLSIIGNGGECVFYLTIPPKNKPDWICVHIGLDDYTILTDYNLLIKDK